MPFLIIIGMLFLWLMSRAKPTQDVPRNQYGSSALGAQKNDAQRDGRGNAKVAVSASAGFSPSFDYGPLSGKKTLTLATDFKGLFEQWKWWVQLPVTGVIATVDNVQYGNGSDLTIPFTLDSVERRTEDRHFDIAMRCFMDLLSVDENGNPLEPYKFKMGIYYGYLPEPLRKEVVDRLKFVREKFRGNPNGGSSGVDEIRKFYFTVIGKPTHNLYGELWTNSLSFQNWIIRMYQGFLWYLVRDAGFRKSFPSPYFPLTESDNKLTTGRNGMPKVDYDGYSNVVIDTDTIGRMYVSSIISEKLKMGKNSLIAKLLK
jgi:hypothetical protein